MKRIFEALTLFMCIISLTACDSSMAKEKRLSLTTDQFPVYDFLTNVFSKEADVTLVENQNDENVKNADLFVCISSDGFAENVFEIKKEVEIEGENVFVSPQKAIDSFFVIYNKIISLDNSLEEKCRDNYDLYVVDLQNINSKMKSGASGKSLIIADDINLKILEKDYGFKVKTLNDKTGSVVSVVSEMKKENNSAVFYIKGGSNEAATVAGNMTNAYVLPIELCDIKDLRELRYKISYRKMLDNNAKNFAMR